MDLSEEFRPTDFTLWRTSWRRSSWSANVGVDGMYIDFSEDPACAQTCLGHRHHSSTRDSPRTRNWLSRSMASRWCHSQVGYPNDRFDEPHAEVSSHRTIDLNHNRIFEPNSKPWSSATFSARRAVRRRTDGTNGPGSLPRRDSCSQSLPLRLTSRLSKRRTRRRHPRYPRRAVRRRGSDTADDGKADADTPDTQAYLPSSFGMSFCVDGEAKSLLVTAYWGQYKREVRAEQTDFRGKTLRVWNAVRPWRHRRGPRCGWCDSRFSSRIRNSRRLHQRGRPPAQDDFNRHAVPG